MPVLTKPAAATTASFVRLGGMLTYDCKRRRCTMRFAHAAAALAASAVFALTAVATAGPSPFTGVWKSTDTDGSRKRS
jgi:hypothetical protein